MRSRIADLVITDDGFFIKSFRMAYSVRVRCTELSPQHTQWEAVSSVISENVRISEMFSGDFLSLATILASSSRVSKGFVT